jgi:hypothetical protein
MPPSLKRRRQSRTESKAVFRKLNADDETEAARHALGG